jgi:cyclohexyl-isocyanide hydratase
MLGEDIAKMTQLAMEYDPQPPFNAGTPKVAGPELTRKVMDWLEPLNAKMWHACKETSKALTD